MEEKLAQILAYHKDRQGALIPLLQKVQQNSSYPSPEAASQISDSSRSDTFEWPFLYPYTQFHRNNVVRRVWEINDSGPEKPIEMNLKDRGK